MKHRLAQTEQLGVTGQRRVPSTRISELQSVQPTSSAPPSTRLLAWYLDRYSETDMRVFRAEHIKSLAMARHVLMLCDVDEAVVNLQHVTPERD